MTLQYILPCIVSLILTGIGWTSASIACEPSVCSACPTMPSFSPATPTLPPNQPTLQPVPTIQPSPTIQPVARPTPASPGGEPCTFEAYQRIGKPLGSWADTKYCVESFQFSEARRTETLNLLDRILAMYSSKTLVKNSGPPFNIAVDIDARLSQIRQAVYSNDHSFHEAVSSLFRSVRDQHTLYLKPACYNVLFIQGARMVPELDTVDTQRIVVRGAPPSSFAITSADYAAFTGVDASVLHGRIVTHIDGVDAMTRLMQFADTLQVSKDATARFNAAVSAFLGGSPTFDVRPLIVYEMPTHAEITYTYLDAQGVSKTLTLPWAVSHFDVHLGSLTQSKALWEQQCLFTNRRRASRLRHARTTPYQLVLRLNAATLPEPLPDTAVRAALTRERWQQSGANAFGDEFAKRQVSVTALNYMTVYAHTASQAAVIRVPSFIATPKQGVSDTYGAFRSDILTAYNIAKQYDRVVLDLSGNYGGYVCLALEMLQYFYPNIDPYFTVYDTKYSVAGNEFNALSTAASFAFGNASFHLQPNGPPYTPHTDFSFYTNTRSLMRAGTPTLFSQPYRQACYSTQALSAAPTATEWTDDNIMLLSDGLCGSACALFVAAFAELNGGARGRLVSYGGTSAASQSIEMTTFAGGRVTSLEYINDVTTWYNQYRRGANPVLPPPLPYFPHSGNMQVNEAEGFRVGDGLAAGNTDLPREFTSTPSTQRINVWPIDYEVASDVQKLHAAAIDAFNAPRGRRKRDDGAVARARTRRRKRADAPCKCLSCADGSVPEYIGSVPDGGGDGDGSLQWWHIALILLGVCVLLIVTCLIILMMARLKRRQTRPVSVATSFAATRSYESGNASPRASSDHMMRSSKRNSNRYSLSHRLSVGVAGGYAQRPRSKRGSTQLPSRTHLHRSYGHVGHSGERQAEW